MINILLQANEIVKRKWNTTGRGWKVFLVIAIIILSIIGLVALIIWGTVRLLMSLAVGGTRNMDLYFPKAHRRSR